MINGPLAVRVSPGSTRITSAFYSLGRIGPCHAQFQRTEKTDAASISDDQACQKYGQTVYMLAGGTHGSDQTPSTFSRCTSAAVGEESKNPQGPRDSLPTNNGGAVLK